MGAGRAHLQWSVPAPQHSLGDRQAVEAEVGRDERAGGMAPQAD